MRILIALTYYRPHYSGLTIYAERLARALVQRGNRVTVLTSRYDPQLMPHEDCDGVQVVRPRVGLHISKGVLMPSMPYWAWKLVKEADIVHLHLPQLDAALIGMIARLQRKPVVLTYHCDLLLPRGFLHSLANQVSNIANHISASLAHSIVTNTLDYAQSSSYLQRYLVKVKAIYPPVELEQAHESETNTFKEKVGLQPGERIIGMAARLATEKGVEFLAQALPAVLERHPQARVLYVGQYENVWGEAEYANRLKPILDRLGERWKFLGIVSPAELRAFFDVCDVVTVPSLNSTESFSIVQVEAMICGTPVVASDLPGVRQPVKLTGMGKIVPPADADALAQALISILDHPEEYRGDPKAVAEMFAPSTIAAQYEALFCYLLGQDG
jgi:glycosyltransferase involved in cell wall biosynthesis